MADYWEKVDRGEAISPGKRNAGALRAQNDGDTL